MGRSVNGEMSMFIESALCNFVFQFMLICLPLQVVSIVYVLFKEMKQKVLDYLLLCVYSVTAQIYIVHSYSSHETGSWEGLVFSLFPLFLQDIMFHRSARLRLRKSIWGKKKQLY